MMIEGRGQLKCDGTRAETRFRLSAKWTSPFKSAGASVRSTTGSRGVRISGSNAGYTMFRGSVKGTGCPLHSPVSPSLPFQCVTICHHISTGVYLFTYILSEGTELEAMPSDHSRKPKTTTTTTHTHTHTHTQFRLQSVDCREPMQSTD